MNVVLSAACFADCEIAGLEGHVGGLCIYSMVFGLAVCECRAMVKCLCIHVSLKVGVSRAAGP
jgi:hypothetical protein